MEKTPSGSGQLVHSKAGKVFFWIFLLSGFFFAYWSVVKVTGSLLWGSKDSASIPFSESFSMAIFCLGTAIPLYMFYYKGVNMFEAKTLFGSLLKYALYAVLFFIIIGVVESIYYF